jgi:hypothetical protein
VRLWRATQAKSVAAKKSTTITCQKRKRGGAQTDPRTRRRTRVGVVPSLPFRGGQQ